MNIALMYWKRILNSRLHMAFMLLVPVALSVATVGVFSTSSPLAIGWVDEDNTALSQSLSAHLAAYGQIVPLERDEIRGQLVQGNLHAAVILPDGLQAEMLSGGRPGAVVQRIQEADIVRPFTMSLDTALNSAYLLAQTSNGEEETFLQAWKSYADGRFRLETRVAEGRDVDRAMVSVGFLVMSMLFLSSLSTIYIVRDRQERTIMRVLLAPVTLRRYMVEAIASFLGISVVQVLLVVGVLWGVFGFSFGPNPLVVMSMLLTFCLVSVSLGVSITTYVPSVRAASTTASLLITPMCMLGGCFWPQAIMPEILQRLSLFVPTTWAVQGAQTALAGGTFMELQLEFALLLLFAVVFLLLGSWRKPDVLH